MKTTFVRDLKNLVGSKAQDKFAVVSKLNRTTRKGRPYWQLVLADSSGQVAGRIWSNFDHAGQAFDSGHVLEVAAMVETYAGELQLNIEKFRRLSVSEFEFADFPKGTTGDSDDFAEPIKFEVAAGTWVMTDVSSEVALRSQEATGRFKEKYLNPSQKAAMPRELPSKAIARPASQPSEGTAERTTELKREYLRKPEGA